MSHELGRLWTDVWTAHSGALAGALLRLREQATSCQARWAGLHVSCMWVFKKQDKQGVIIQVSLPCQGRGG